MDPVLNRTPPLATLIEKVKRIDSVSAGQQFYNEVSPGVADKPDDICYCSGTAMVLSLYLSNSSELSHVAACNDKGTAIELGKNNGEAAADRLTELDAFVGYGVSAGDIGHDWVVAKAKGQYGFFQANANQDKFYLFPKLNPASKDDNRYMNKDSDFRALLHDLTSPEKVGSLMPLKNTAWRLFVAH